MEGKTKETDGIMVISCFFFLFHIYMETCEKFIICLLLIYMFFCLVFVLKLYLFCPNLSKHLKYPDVE